LYSSRSKSTVARKYVSESESQFSAIKFKKYNTGNVHRATLTMHFITVATKVTRESAGQPW
jgi:hypothetical protein